MVTHLAPGIDAIDLAIHLPNNKTLIVSDFHIGYESDAASKGVLLPRLHLKDTLKRLDGIFEKTGPVETVIINGDLKHEFGRISVQEWRDVLKVIDHLKAHCNKLIIVRGNHDTTLEPIARNRDVELVTSHRLQAANGKRDTILITHGDIEPTLDTTDKLVIIGHEHPAITIRSATRSERYKCFLKTKYKRRTLIVQPSFNLLTEGTDMTKEELLSPLLKNVRDADVFVVDEKKQDVLAFGKLKDLYTP